MSAIGKNCITVPQIVINGKHFLINSSIDAKEKQVEEIYTKNKIDQKDKLLANFVPLFDSTLENFSASLGELESEFSKNLEQILVKDVANLVNNWMFNVTSLETIVNQHYKFPVGSGLSGAEIIADFVDRVYREFSDESKVLVRLAKSGKATVDDKRGLVAKWTDIIEEFHREQTDFFKGKKAEADKLIKTGQYARQASVK